MPRFIFGTILVVFLLAGCSDPGFRVMESLVNDPANTDTEAPDRGNGGGSQTPGDTQPPVSISPEYQKLNLDSRVDGGSYDQEPVATLDKAQKKIYLRLPLPRFSNYQPSVRTLTEPRAIEITIRPSTTGSTDFEAIASLPLAAFLDSTTLLPLKSTLPNGSPLPGMNGSFPVASLSMGNGTSENLYLYLGKGRIGFFIESAYFPEFMTVASPVLNSAGLRNFGSLTIVPKVGSVFGGLFLHFYVPIDIEIILRSAL